MATLFLKSKCYFERSEQNTHFKIARTNDVRKSFIYPTTILHNSDKFHNEATNCLIRQLFGRKAIQCYIKWNILWLWI